MVVFYLLLGFLTFDFKLGTLKKVGCNHQSCGGLLEIKRWQQRRGEQQFPNGSCWGTLQKKLIAPSAGGGGPGGSRVFV